VNVTDVSSHQYVQLRNRVVQFTAQVMAFSLLQSVQITSGKQSVPFSGGTEDSSPTPLSSAEGENEFSTCPDRVHRENFPFLYFIYL